jgi:hypothetical protein
MSGIGFEGIGEHPIPIKIKVNIATKDVIIILDLTKSETCQLQLFYQQQKSAVLCSHQVV